MAEEIFYEEENGYLPVDLTDIKHTYYKNAVNTIDYTTPDMAAADQNILFGLITAGRGQDLKKGFWLTYAQLRKIVGRELRRKEVTDIYITKDYLEKIASFKISRETKGGEGVIINIFSSLYYSDRTERLMVRFTPEFCGLITFAYRTGNFTVMDFAQFLSIRTAYSKKLFRHLKQWRRVGEVEWELSEFQRLLQYPESYNKDMDKLTERILNPSKKALSPYFEGLTISKEKKGNNKKYITHIKYKFQPDRSRLQEGIETKTDSSFQEGTMDEERLLLRLGGHKKVADDLKKWLGEYHFTEAEIEGFVESGEARGVTSLFAWVSKCVENGRPEKREQYEEERKRFYKNRQENADRRLEANRKKAYEFPEVEEKVKEILNSSLLLFRLGDGDKEKEKEKIGELRKDITTTLEGIGMDADDILAIKPVCDLCGDTGYIDGSARCSCYDELLTKK